MTLDWDFEWELTSLLMEYVFASLMYFHVHGRQEPKGLFFPNSSRTGN